MLINYYIVISHSLAAFFGGLLGQGIKSGFFVLFKCFIENCSNVSPLPYASDVFEKLFAFIASSSSSSFLICSSFLLAIGCPSIRNRQLWGIYCLTILLDKEPPVLVPGFCPLKFISYIGSPVLIISDLGDLSFLASYQISSLFTCLLHILFILLTFLEMNW